LNLKVLVLVTPVACLFLLTGGCRQRSEAQSRPSPAVTPSMYSQAPSVSVAPALPARKVASEGLAAGTSIQIIIAETLDSGVPSELGFLLGNVAQDVTNAAGGLLLPAESRALLIVRGSGKVGGATRMVLGLNRLETGGKTYKLTNGAKDIATLTFEESLSQGAGHGTVHLQKNALLTFTLDQAVQPL
jgi:hypothetical protein